MLRSYFELFSIDVDLFIEITAQFFFLHPASSCELSIPKLNVKGFIEQPS